MAGSRRSAASRGATFARRASTAEPGAVTSVPPARQYAADAARSSVAAIVSTRASAAARPRIRPLRGRQPVEGGVRGDEHVDVREESDVRGGVRVLRKPLGGRGERLGLAPEPAADGRVSVAAAAATGRAPSARSRSSIAVEPVERIVTPAKSAGVSSGFRNPKARYIPSGTSPSPVSPAPSRPPSSRAASGPPVTLTESAYETTRKGACSAASVRTPAAPNASAGTTPSWTLARANRADRACTRRPVGRRDAQRPLRERLDAGGETLGDLRRRASGIPDHRELELHGVASARLADGRRATARERRERGGGERGEWRPRHGRIIP